MGMHEDVGRYRGKHMGMKNGDNESMSESLQLMQRYGFGR